jgi:SsrA-binding protein
MAKSEKTKSSKHSPQTANKKAFFNYEILEKVEAGIVLTGTEVKSLRDGGGDLEGAYARITGGECWLIGCKIAPYARASITNHPPLRDRKLLLHNRQIAKLISKSEQAGCTLVPLRIYFSERGFAKVEVAVARGKRQYDKRDAIAKREQKKEIDRSTKKYRR